jgi:Fe-S cluster assembly protein SufD
MSAAMDDVREQLLARFQERRERLPGDGAPRSQAAASFRATGLPGPHDEAWKYTHLRALSGFAFDDPRWNGDVQALITDLALPDVPTVILANGVPQESATALPPGISGFAAAPTFGASARVDREPLVALNTMFAEDGVIITVPPGIDIGTLVLVSATFGRAAGLAAVHPRHRIVLGEGSRASILEVAVGEGQYFHNAVSEIVVGSGATLVHARLQQEATSAIHVASLYVDVAEAATYDGFTLNLGAQLCRTEIHARLHGSGGTTHLNAAQLLGNGQHGDFTTVVSHDAPSCASRQTVKNVLSGRSRGVFQGKIEVARVAQKTDGYQMNQALLLSPEAEIDSKPQLEIFADDVKCSHGATVGELDAEQVFYLRSRGISEAEARAILVRAFLEDSLADVSDTAVRAVLVAALDRCWGKLAS